MLQRKTTELPLEQICTNPDQPRKFFAEEELNDLKNSIAEYGVLQPVIVKKERSGEYSLIAGERRVRAAKLAGLTKIPAIVKDFDDRDAALISVVENVQRENLSYIEEAYAYKRRQDRKAPVDYIQQTEDFNPAAGYSEKTGGGQADRASRACASESGRSGGSGEDSSAGDQ